MRKHESGQYSGNQLMKCMVAAVKLLLIKTGRGKAAKLQVKRLAGHIFESFGLSATLLRFH